MANHMPVPIQPAADGTAKTSKGYTVVGRPNQQASCDTCARRKVRCDRAQPCSTCRKGQFTCEYTDRPARKRARKDIEDLQGRIDRYEQLLETHGIAVEGTVPEVPSQPDPTRSSGLMEPAGVLLPDPDTDRSRYVTSHVWRDLADDLHPSSDEEDYVNAASVAQPASDEPFDPFGGPAASSAAALGDFRRLLSNPDRAKSLWRIYVRNVDPLVRIVHRTSTDEVVNEAIRNPTGLTKENVGLLLSIYHFAIVSMPETEREAILGSSSNDIQHAYHEATKQALVACNLYQTTSLTVFQAYVNLLVSVRFEYNPHTFWILSGIAVRLAQRMGLDSQATSQLNPFDIQMRRRLWWSVILLDQFAAHQSGTTAATLPPQAWDIPLPLNLDDTDIYPGMSYEPQGKRGPTDMMIYLIRLEISAFRARLQKSDDRPDPGKLEASLSALEDHVESKYLRYCDVTNPVQFLGLVGSRAALLNARLRSHLTVMKTGHASSQQRREALALALKLLDHDASMTSSPVISFFAWQWQALFSWEPLICALKEMCYQEPPGGDEVAWHKLERVWAGHSNLLDHRRAIEVAIGRLAVRTWDVTQRRSSHPSAEPSFIRQLRDLLRRRSDAKRTRTTVVAELPIADERGSEHVSSEAGPRGTDIVPWDELGADVDWSFWDELLRNPEADYDLFE